MNGNFLSRPVNGGKWSECEEMYAAALIEAFKAGELPDSDIDEGTSLRKYLAKKLMCSPKRISKKFEGTGYNGKQVYFRKDRTKFLPNPALAAAKLSALQQLERNFLLALTETQNAEPAGIAKSTQARNPGYGALSTFIPDGSRKLTMTPTIPPASDATLPPTSWLDQSSVAALKARAELSVLIQQRDMLTEMLGKSEPKTAVASAGPQLGQGALHANAAPGSAVEMILASTNGTAGGTPGVRRLQKTSLASSLAQHRVASLTAGSALPNSLDYQALLQSSMSAAMAADISTLTSPRQHTRQALPHDSPVTFPKRPLSGDEDRSAKRARLPLL